MKLGRQKHFRAEIFVCNGTRQLDLSAFNGSSNMQANDPKSVMGEFGKKGLSQVFDPFPKCGHHLWVLLIEVATVGVISSL